MTAWADLIETGIGGEGIEYRLVIEGAPYEFCTTEEMSGACSESGQTGKFRVPGLLREGLGFSESAYLAGADLSISINAVRIMETPAPYLNAATSMFTSFAEAKTHLSATLSTSATSMAVNSDEFLATDTVYHISTEAVRITAFPGINTATISRAQWRTFAQAHQASVTGNQPAVRAVRDGVQFWSGRRVWLYAHGPSEFGLGDVGELVWRGRLADEPQLEGGDAVVWNLTIESRWAMFDQEIASATDEPLQLRGAYYPAGRELELRIGRSADEFQSQGRPAIETIIVPAGHYDTEQQFADAVMTAINANSTISAWPEKFYTSIVDGRWELCVLTPASDPRYIHVYGGSAVDGNFIGALQDAGIFQSINGGVWEVGRRSGADSDHDRPEVQASSDYVCLWTEVYTDGTGYTTTVPRDQMRRHPRVNNRPLGRPLGTFAEYAANPCGRFYLQSVAGISAGDTLMVEQPRAADDSEVPPRSYYILDVNTTDNYIDAAFDPMTDAYIASGGVHPELKIAKRYGGGDGITLDGFRDALVTASPGSANDGSTPWVLDDDLADWADVVNDAASGSNFLQLREYTFQKSTRLADVMKHEARLYGLFFYLDADFKIAVRPLTLSTQTPAYTLSDEDGTVLTESGFGEMKSGMDGNVNVVELSTGYDPSEDKHKGGTIAVQRVESISESKKRRVLEIKPKSRSLAGEATPGHVYELAGPVLTMFGSRIVHYTFTVPITYWSVLIGDTVTVTSSTMPYDGARGAHDPGSGMRTRTGLVVGREWDLVEGTGRLTVLVSSLRLSGYAPSGRIASASGSGTSWTLTLEANRYAPAGTTDASFFRVGDMIRVYQWDADSPLIYTGEIDSISGNDIAVTLDSSWAGLSGNIYNLIYQEADFQYTAPSSFQYAFVAGTERTVYDGDVTVYPAYKFGP